MLETKPYFYPFISENFPYNYFFLHVISFQFILRRIVILIWFKVFKHLLKIIVYFRLSIFSLLFCLILVTNKFINKGKAIKLSMF